MYPTGELNHLAARKSVLRARIALNRFRVAEDCSRVAPPLRLVDRVLAIWRGMRPILPLLAAPLGWWAARSGAARMKVPAALLRWGMLANAALRGWRAWEEHAGRR